MIEGSSTESAVQKRPPSRDTWIRSAVAKTTRSGCSGEIATATPAPSPAPVSRQVLPPSCETTSGGFRPTTARIVEPWPAAATSRGRSTSGSAGASSGSSPTSSDLVLVEVDLDRSERAGDEHARHASASIAATSREARSAAATGSRPLCPTVEVDERERVTGAGGVRRGDGMRRDRRVELGGDDPRALRAEREDDLGDAEREQALRVERAREDPSLVLVELQHREVREHGPVDVGVSLERADAGDADDALRVEQEPASVACERRDRRCGKVRAEEPGDEHPAGIGERRRCPAGDVVGRPWIADRVDRHHAVVALVVEAERRRLPPVGGRDGHVERLERREGRRAVGGRAARHGDDVRADPRRGSRGVEDTAARARSAAVDAVDAGVADERDAAHARAGRTPSLPVAAASASASTNATAKLGSVAPIDHEGGSRRCTCSTHHAGPVGESHW